MTRKLATLLSLTLISTISCTSLTSQKAAVEFCDRTIASNTCEGIFHDAKKPQRRAAWPLAADNFQHPTFITWAKDKRSEVKTLNHDKETNSDTHFNIPEYIAIKPKKVVRPSEQVIKRIADTTKLYHEQIGHDSINSLLWTGIESGNPLTRFEEYRWNSLKEQGMYEPAKRQKFIAKLHESGIKNIRMGMSNHEIDLKNDASWKEHDQMMKDLSDGGLNIALDMHHFGIEDHFRVVGKDGKTDGRKSYYLNKDWPDYFAKFAAKAYSRYHKQIKAITLMNEPETVVGFNGEMWHGGFPGWGHPEGNFYYIERAIQVGKASVKARLAIEAEARKIHGRNARPLYVHTEAAVHKTYWDDFNSYIRFMTSDMILGHEWLTTADLKQVAEAPIEFDPARPEETKDALVGRWHRKKGEERTSLDWVIENYVVYNQPAEKREANRQRLVQLLSELKNLHADLGTKFGKNMRTDTSFAVDYYAHNEDKDIKGDRLSPEPQYYGDEIRAGRRTGLYPVLVDYFNHFQMPLMIGESGTPYYFYGSRWNEQMLLECASAAESGIPFLGYVMYPAIDTWGWESALSVPKDKALFNPSGIVTLEMEPKYFVGRMLQSLKARMPLK